MTALTLLLACGGPPRDRRPGPDDTDPPVTAHSAESTPPPPWHTGPRPHTGLPEPVYDGVFADCPRFDWMLTLSTSTSEYLYDVLPVDGGDVLVVGKFSGQPVFSTDGVTRLEHALGPLNVFVARVRPDGTLAWSRTLTGGLDGEFGAIRRVDGGFWVVGGYNGGPLRVDGVEVGGVDWHLSSVFALRFSLRGDLQRSLFHHNDISCMGMDLTEDADGNVVILEEATTGLDHHELGRLRVPKVNSFHNDVLLASWDADDRPRWLTVLGIEPLYWPLRATRLAPADSGSLAILEQVYNPVHVYRHDGSHTVHHFNDVGSALVPFDDRGVVSDSGWQITRTLLKRLEPDGPGQFRAVGDLLTPGQWIDPEGVVHSVEFPLGGIATLGGLFEVDQSGAIHAVTTTAAFDNQYTVRRQPDGSSWWGGRVGYERAFGVGTERAWTAPTTNGGMAAQYDATGAFHCGVYFDGNAEVHDLTVATDGALWLAGIYRDGDVDVYTPYGRVAHRGGEGSILNDAFLARFAPAPPP